MQHEKYTHEFSSSKNLISRSLSTPVLNSDNQGALTIAENPTNYQRAKHIDIRYHFIRHVLEHSQVRIDFTPTALQPADVLTKALGPQKYLQSPPLMGLHTTAGNH